MDKAKLNKLSKVKLEEFARPEGIELDRRKTANMIEDYLMQIQTVKHWPAKTTDAKKKYNTIEVNPEDVAKEKAFAEEAVVAKGLQLAEFEKFIPDELVMYNQHVDVDHF